LEPSLLHPDFRDLLAALAAEKVEYLVVGSYAVGFQPLVKPGNAAETRSHISLAFRTYVAVSRLPSVQLRRHEANLDAIKGSLIASLI